MLKMIHTRDVDENSKISKYLGPAGAGGGKVGRVFDEGQQLPLVM